MVGENVLIKRSLYLVWVKETRKKKEKEILSDIVMTESCKNSFDNPGCELFFQVMRSLGTTPIYPTVCDELPTEVL